MNAYWADHDAYEKAPEETREAIDRAFLAMVGSLHESGVQCDMSDAAEQLVGAMFRYVEASK